MKHVAAEDWTAEAIARFWEYFGSRPHREEQYFSHNVGDGVALFLALQGVLRGRVLDYGCGPGFLLDYMSHYDVVCLGVDPSPASVERANRRCAGKPSFRGAFTLPADGVLKDGAFDLVTCVETVEHVPAAAAPELLGELRRLLRPGGSLLVTTPLDERLENAMTYCPFCDREFHHMQHLRSFTPATLTGLLRDNGFAVTFCRGIDLGRLRDDFRQLPRPATLLAKARYRLGKLLGRPWETPRQRLDRLTVDGTYLVALATPGT
jgi:SAM-dependent methyltransferase